MTKKEIVNVLKNSNGDQFEITAKNQTEKLYYLVLNTPCTSDDYDPEAYDHVFHSIYDFETDLFELIDVATTDFINVKPIFNKKKETKNQTILWYKVKCSLFKEEFGVKLWKDVVEFLSKTIGFDITITGQTTRPFTGVSGFYEDGSFYEL